MYEPPPPITTRRRQRRRLIQGLVLIGLIPWSCLLIYAGVGGNLVTMALGLPNHPFIIKILATGAVLAVSVVGALGLARWLDS